ncbi:MAG: PD-(D/E)XK nuclease family protein [Chloroflexi bacterium]|nr:PD-(D/E)XK nuclease family protein [Chloroflexota bacterium]
MADRIRISAKALGEVALSGFCPRCFWIKLRMRNRLPFQIFPGIFSSIDSYSKRVVHSWFDRHQRPPDWLQGLGALSGYVEPPSYTTFQIVNEEYNVLLTGSPDGVFVREDGSHLIVDYKTSRHTKNQDKLYPMYETQLNAYAQIGEQCGLNPVSGLALIYTEPLTDDGSASDDAIHNGKGFAMGFSVHIVDVPLNVKMLEPLLAKTREIHDLPNSPSGRTDCKDCQQLDSLLELAGD